MNDNIRVGTISSIDYGSGRVKVLYTDRDGSVTDDIPYLCFNNEYKMPKIDDMVLVLHLSNNTSFAAVLGMFWNDENIPVEAGKGLYRKDFGDKPSEAYLKYHNGIITMKAEKITLITEKGTFDY